VGACRVPHVLDLSDMVSIRRIEYFSFNYHQNGA